MPGSLITDLPTYPGKAIDVSLVSGNPDNYISIKNLLQIYSTTTYSVEGRASIASSGSRSEFGKISIYPIKPDGTSGVLKISESAINPVPNLFKSYEYSQDNGAGAGVHRSGVGLEKAGYAWVVSSIESSDLTTIDSTFMGKVYGSGGYLYSGIPYNSAKTIEKLVFLLKPSLDQLCCATFANCEDKTGNIPTCSLSATFVPDIYMGMIANSNILELSTDGGRGLTPNSYWWGGCASSGNCNTGGLSDATRKNQWEIKDNIGYLTFICTSDLLATDNKVCLTINDGANFGALALEKKLDSTSGVFKKDKYSISQLYGSQSILDFIVCFGFKVTTQSAEQTGSIQSYKLASFSLLNTFIMNNELLPNMKARFINYVNNKLSDFLAVPMFLRISGYISSADSSISAVSIFLDSNVDVSTGTTGACAYSSQFSSASCIAYNSDVSRNGNFAYSQRVEITNFRISDANSTSPLEILIPVKPISTSGSDISFKTFNIGIGLQRVDTVDPRFYKLVQVNRLAGFVWSSNWATYNILYQVNTLTPTLPNTITPTGSSTVLASSGVNCGNLAASTATENGFTLSSGFFPGKNFASADIKSYLPTSTCLGTLDDSTTTGLGGTAITIAHKTNDLFSTSRSVWNQYSSKACLNFIISIDQNTKSYGIVCPISTGTATTSIGAASTITVTPFKVPWRWGASFPAVNVGLHFSWSYKGDLAAYWPHSSMGTDQFASACVASDLPVLYKSTPAQRLSIGFTPTLEYLLSATTVVKVQLVMTAGDISSFSLAPACQSVLSSGVATCTASAQGSGVYQFRLTLSAAISVSLNNALQMIYAYGDMASASAGSLSGYVQILVGDVVVEKCSASSQKKIEYFWRQQRWLFIHQ